MTSVFDQKLARRTLFAGFLLLFATSLGGCTQTYYSAMEKIGQDKRDILRSLSLIHI